MSGLTPAAPSSGSTRALQLLTTATFVLGIGAAINEPDPATGLTVLAGVTAGTGFVLLARGGGFRQGGLLAGVLVITIAGNVAIALIAPPLLDAWYRPLLAIVGATAIGAMFTAKLRTGLVLVTVVTASAISAWMVESLNPPDMDVHLFQQEASAAILEGRNPYELRYRNIYGEGTHLYAPEVQTGDRLEFGFPYPPLSLFMALPGYAAAGEYRYAALAATAVTALLLALMRPGPAGAGVAALFILSPLTLRVIYNGWTEPFVGVLIAAAVAVAIRAPRWTPLLLGLLIASKQYVVPLLLPAVTLLQATRERTRVRDLAVMPLTIAALTIVPFLLWNPQELIHSTLLLQAYQPFRPDSVSIPGLVARAGLGVTPTWVAFASGGVVLLAVSRFSPRSPAGFAAATAVFFFAFFLLSKQAFMNYYYVVFVALCCTVAAGAGTATVRRHA